MPGRASTTNTRAPRSVSAVAALKPAQPAPITIASNDSRGINQQFGRADHSCPGGTPEPDRRQLGPRPDGECDARPHEPGDANHFSEHVVAPLLDAFEDLVVDAAHDF